MRRATDTCRSLGRGLRGDRPRAAGARAEERRVLRLWPRLAGNRLHVRRCSRASTATTTCPTARTCATRPRRWRCRRASACRSAPCTLDDFEKTDCILFFGQNVGTSSPRMLHQLQEAAKRGVPIITFNPLRERGLERLRQSAIAGRDADRRRRRRISSQYHQVKAGGDIAAIMGICKALLALDDEAQDGGRAGDRSRFHRRAHARLRRVRRSRAGLRVGRHRAALRPHARRAGSGRLRLCARQVGDRHLRHGPDPAREGRRDRADAGQSAAAARQYRPARRRHLPGARPFQRAGPAHGRHHREAGDGAAGQAQEPVRHRCAARRRASTPSRPARGSSPAGAGRSSCSAAISSAPCRITARSSRPGASCG